MGGTWGLPRPKELSGPCLCLGTGKAAPDSGLEALLRAGDSAAVK